MKKLCFFLFYFVCIASLSAQSKHAKFLGIPLDGTISQFHQKMIKKGYKPNTELNRIFPVGKRAYDGTFLGEDALIVIFYNEKTNIVYLGKAVYHRLKDDMAKKKLANMMDLLHKKYNEAEIFENTKNGLKSFYFENFSDFDGRINLYLTYSDDIEIYPYGYSLHVEYIDSENFDKNEESEMEDL